MHKDVTCKCGSSMVFVSLLYCPPGTPDLNRYHCHDCGYRWAVEDHHETDAPANPTAPDKRTPDRE